MALASKHGMRAWGYAVTPEQATALAGHGAEAIVVHLGITRPGPPTARQAETLTATAAAARAARPDVHLLVHGGPLTSPAAFTALCGQNGVHFGFFGASVFEHATDLERTVRSWRDVLAADRDGR